MVQIAEESMSEAEFTMSRMPLGSGVVSPRNSENGIKIL